MKKLTLLVILLSNNLQAASQDTDRKKIHFDLLNPKKHLAKIMEECVANGGVKPEKLVDKILEYISINEKRIEEKIFSRGIIDMLFIREQMVENIDRVKDIFEEEEDTQFKDQYEWISDLHIQSYKRIVTKIDEEISKHSAKLNSSQTK